MIMELVWKSTQQYYVHGVLQGFAHHKDSGKLAHVFATISRATLKCKETTQLQAMAIRIKMVDQQTGDPQHPSLRLGHHWAEGFNYYGMNEY